MAQPVILQSILVFWKLVAFPPFIARFGGMSEKFSRLALIRFQRMLLFELLHVALLSLQLAGGGVFVNIYPEEKKKNILLALSI